MEPVKLRWEANSAKRCAKSMHPAACSQRHRDKTKIPNGEKQSFSANSELHYQKPEKNMSNIVKSFLDSTIRNPTSRKKLTFPRICPKHISRIIARTFKVLFWPQGMTFCKFFASEVFTSSLETIANKSLPDSDRSDFARAHFHELTQNSSS